MFCCRRNRHSKQRSKQDEKLKASSDRKRRHHFGVNYKIRQFKEVDFQNRNFDRINLRKFWQLLRSGINPGDNIVAQMSSVSIFAFIDKEGIVTDSHKYIDEIVLMNWKGEK